MFTSRAFARGVFAACAFIAASAFAGPEWVEQGDAGSFFESAQPTLGVGQINSIQGSLTGAAPGFGEPSGDFGDVFLFTVQVPTTFTMQIINATFDPQLFLFNITVPGELFGLLANNDTANGNLPAMGNHATDATGAQVLLPGAYAVAVTGFGRIPVGINGDIFNIANPIEVSGPDGPGGINPLLAWTGQGQTGSYIISFTGSGFYAVPTPGTAALLLVAALMMGRRRRR